MKMLLLINDDASSSTLVDNLATHDKKNTEQTCNENIKIKEKKNGEERKTKIKLNYKRNKRAKNML
jgi:hypothetical protein